MAKRKTASKMKPSEEASRFNLARLCASLAGATASSPSSRWPLFPIISPAKQTPRNART